MTINAWTGRIAGLSVRKWLMLAIVPLTIVGALAIGLVTALLASREVARQHVSSGVQLSGMLARNSELPLLYQSGHGIAEAAAPLLENTLVRQVRVIDPAGQVLYDKTRGQPGHWAYPAAPAAGVADIELDDVWLFAQTVHTAKSTAVDPELPEATLLGNNTDEVLGEVQVALGKAELFAAQRSIFVGNVATSLAFSLFLVAATLAVVRRFSRPLESLALSMHEVRAGLWTEPDIPPGPREIRDIAESYKALMADLRQREEDLREFNRTLEEKIRQRTQALEAANQELTAFSYSVSHDLRAPLRAIDGFGKALAEDFGSRLEPQALEYLQRMRDAAQRMSELIDSLLKLSRVTRYDMQAEQVDLSAMAAVVAEQLRELYPDRTLAFRVAPGMIATGDANLLRIALDNLLGNAWKYTGRTAAAEVVFDSATEAGQTIFRVSDNGAGFDMRFSDKLFGAFQRLHGREFEGNGIGLAIVKRIVMRHGGRIWARSEVGHGAEFFFTLAGDPQDGQNGEAADSANGTDPAN
jgi:signal transduction histidine kinase